MEFLKLKFTGKEFVKHKLTLEVLTDLASVGTLIIEAAKFVLKEESGRERAPRNLGKKIKLLLGDVLPGSAMPVIELEAEADEQEMIDAFFAGKRRVLQCIKSARSGHVDESLLPRSSFQKFAKIGKCLDGDSHIEFPDPDNEQFFMPFDEETRKRLALVSETRRQSLSLRGRIFELNVKSLSLWIETNEGNISASFEDRLRAKVLTSIDREVICSGVARLTKEGTIISVEKIEHFSIIGDDGIIEDLNNRLNELAALKSGWCDGILGKEFSREKLKTVELLLTSLAYDFSIPVPRIFPSADENEIRLEWTFNELDVDLNWNIETNICYVVGLADIGDSEFDISSQNEKEKLIKALKKQIRVYEDE
jgi:hypothetical protein